MDHGTFTGDLRSRLRAMRLDLPADEQARRAEAVAIAAAAVPGWATARALGLYNAVAGELDVSVIGRLARDRGVATFVPVLDGDRLRFAAVTPSTTWAPNRFGIDEPVDTDRVDADTLDLVVLPAVAVDRAGNRIGMGAGYYDRTFATLRGVEPPGRPLLVAAVHEEQVVDALEPAPWDVPVDAVITPVGVIVTTASGRR